MEKEKTTSIIVIILCIIAIVIFGFWKPFTISSEKTDFVYKVYVDSATYTQTPDFVFGDSYIKSTSLKWLCSRDDFETSLGYRTDNVSVLVGTHYVHFTDYEIPKYHTTNRYFNVGDTPKTCWQATLTYFDGITEKSYIMNPDDEVILDKYRKVKMNPTGKVYYGTKRISMPWRNSFKTEKYYFEGEYMYPWDWQINYEFKIINKEFLNAKIDDKNLIVKLNSNKEVPIKIYNDFANNIKGGLSWYTNAELISEEHFGKEEFSFKKGLNEYYLPVSTNLLGYTFLKAQPYIFLEVPRSDEIYLYDDHVSSERYNIVTEVSEILDTGIRCPCPSGMYCKQVEYQGIKYGICMKGEEPINYQPDDIISKKDYSWLWIGLVAIIIAGIIVWKKKQK